MRFTLTDLDAEFDTHFDSFKALVNYLTELTNEDYNELSFLEVVQMTKQICTLDFDISKINPRYKLEVRE